MKRILFVDDEPRILEGLQRMLRPLRAQWHMTFVQSGPAALEILAREPCDVIVTDMRMPGMDGAQLLGQVREKFPAVIRIVLSGYFDTQAALRAVPVAHQFLTKPCDAGKLRAAIEHSCQCNSLIADEATRRVIAAVGELPALPSTYAALLAALKNPDVSLNHIGMIIERDIGIAAKVLQLVNSAFFGLSNPIPNVRQAVGYLGLDVLRHVVLTVEIFRVFEPKSDIAGFSVESLQAHSRATAEIASRLPVSTPYAGAAFIASLLHDVGKLILAARLPEPFQKSLQAACATKRPLYVVEEEMSGVSHSDVGAYLLGLWGLPAEIVSAVSLHHHPEWPSEAVEIPLAAAVWLADALAIEAQPDAHPIDCDPDWTDRIPAGAWRDRLSHWRDIAAQAWPEIDG